MPSSRFKNLPRFGHGIGQTISALLGVRVVDMRQPSLRFKTLFGISSDLWDRAGETEYSWPAEARPGLGERPRLDDASSSDWVDSN